MVSKKRDKKPLTEKEFERVLKKVSKPLDEPSQTSERSGSEGSRTSEPRRRDDST